MRANTRSHKKPLKYPTYTGELCKKFQAEVVPFQKFGADRRDLDVPDERKQAESDGDPCSHGVGLTELRCVGYLILIPSSAFCWLLCCRSEWASKGVFQQGHVIFPLIHYAQLLSSDCMIKPQLKKKKTCPLCFSLSVSCEREGQIFIFDDVTNSGWCIFLAVLSKLPTCWCRHSRLLAGGGSVSSLISPYNVCFHLRLRRQLEPILTDALPQSGAFSGVVSPLQLFAGPDCDGHTASENTEALGFSKWTQAKAAQLQSLSFKCVCNVGSAQHKPTLAWFWCKEKYQVVKFPPWKTDNPWSHSDRDAAWEKVASVGLCGESQVPVPVCVLLLYR